jgi:predicted NBD/HSP70 family sugar kinase
MTKDAIAAIDIGGTKIALGLVDLNGQIQPFHRFPTQVERGPHMIIDQVLNELERMARGSSPSASGAAGRWIVVAG